MYQNKINLESFFITKYILVIFLLILSIFTFANAQTNNIGAMQLSLVSNHEDSSVQIKIDMTKLNYKDYLSLGVYCVKENGKTDFAVKNISPVCGNVLNNIENKIYTTTVSNLNPSSEYEFCLNGTSSKYTSTGNFECAKINTQSKKSSVAMIYINYDVSQNTRNLIKRYEDSIRLSNPDVSIVEYSPQQTVSSSELLEKLRNTYKSSNLKYLLMIGFDLPVPMTQESVYFADPYRHLSIDEVNMKRDFLYTLNSEISISVIKAEDEKEMQDYFNRLHRFYTGELKFDKKLFIADAMIPSESSINLSDVPARYNLTSTDYINGITSYYDSKDIDITKWQNDYQNLLSKSHEITIINAHGATNFHMPCRMNASNNEQGCISSSFIKNTKPNSQFIIGVSCNIGNFMTKGSPMNAYIFSGNALAGLGAEVPLWDQNSYLAKNLLKSLSEGVRIGDLSLKNGLVVIGDPFLKIGLVQNYKSKIEIEGIKSMYPVSGAPGTKVTLTISNPDNIPIGVGDFNFGSYGLVNFSNSNNTITFNVPKDAKSGYYDVVWFSSKDSYSVKFNVVSSNSPVSINTSDKEMYKFDFGSLLSNISIGFGNLFNK